MRYDRFANKKMSIAARYNKHCKHKNEKRRNPNRPNICKMKEKMTEPQSSHISKCMKPATNKNGIQENLGPSDMESRPIPEPRTRTRTRTRPRLTSKQNEYFARRDAAKFYHTEINNEENPHRTPQQHEPIHPTTPALKHRHSKPPTYKIWPPSHKGIACSKPNKEQQQKQPQPGMWQWHTNSTGKRQEKRNVENGS